MAAAGGPARVLTVTVGGQALAIDAAAVAEVTPSPPITRVPQSPAGLKGLASIRGQVVPIVALAALIDGARGGEGARVVLLNRAEPVGLAVDEVRAMRDVAASRKRARGFVETEDGPARLVDLEPLLQAAFGGAGPVARRARSTGSRADSAPRAAVADRAFLEFDLAGQAYGLPLQQVREVIAAPPAITALPHTDAAMLGVVPVRDRLLPIVSMATVLGLPPTQLGAAARVVVVAVGETEVALLVGGVRGILRIAEDRLDPVPGMLNRGAGEARIEAVARAPHGLVSLLTAGRLLDEATTAAVLAETGERAVADASEEHANAMRQLVIFRLGDETYGLPIEAVEAVITLPERITRAPKAPAFVVGVASHRGRVLPLIDQAKRFGAKTSPGARRRVVVTQIDGLLAGFVVDAVEEILRVPDEQLQRTPGLATGEAALFDQVVTADGARPIVLLVDPRAMLDQAERDLVRAIADRPAAPA